MNRKWKQRPFVGKGKERRKGRGWGAAPSSSASDGSGRPGGFLPGTSRGRCSSVALRRPRGARYSTAGHSPERRARGKTDTKLRATHPTSPAHAPPRSEGSCPRADILTWDPSGAALAVRSRPADLKPAPPSPLPSPGAGPQQSPGDLSSSSLG